MADQLVSAVSAGDQSRYGSATVVNAAQLISVQGWQSLHVSYPSAFDASINGGLLNFNLITALQGSIASSVRFDFGVGARLITGVSASDTSLFGGAGVANSAQACIAQGFNSNSSTPALIFLGQYALTHFNHTQAKLSTNAVNVPFIFGGASLISAVGLGDQLTFGTIEKIKLPATIRPLSVQADARYGNAIAYSAGRAGGLNFNLTSSVLPVNAKSVRFDFGVGARLVTAVGGFNSAGLGAPSVVNAAQGVIAGAGLQQKFGQTITYHALTELDVIVGANLDFNLIENLKPANALNVPFYFNGEKSVKPVGWVGELFGSVNVSPRYLRLGGFDALGLGSPAIVHVISSLSPSGFSAQSFGNVVFSGRLTAAGFVANTFGTTTTFNLKQYLPSASVYSFQSGEATVSNRARVVFASGWQATAHSTHGINNKNQFVFAGLGGSSLAFGDSVFINRNTYTAINGIQSAHYGVARVEHYRRGILVGGIPSASVGTLRITNANRIISPSGIYVTYPSGHMIGGTRYILPQGFSATRFGARIIPEIQAVYTFGVSGAFGLTGIANRRKVISGVGFLTGGTQPVDRWGMAHTYNKRQYIIMSFDGESGLNPPAWSIWAKVANRNRIVATFGKKETLFAEPIIANNARIVVAQSIVSQDAPPFYKSGAVSHRIRAIPTQGIESFSSSTWAVVYNNARVINTVGKDCALFGVAKAVKTRRYFDHIGGFDSFVFGNGMISYGVRSIVFDSRYAIAPLSIKLPEIKLFTRYINGIGLDLSGLGSPSLSIHFNRITPRWTLKDAYGYPTLRNVTPEVHTYGRNTEEYGDALVRLEWRPVNTFGENHQVSGKPEIAYRDRKRFITGFNAGAMGDKVKVIKSGAPPYTLQNIYASGIEVPLGTLFGISSVNQRVLYVLSVQTSAVFGNVSVVANTIRVEPGYQELLVGSPMVSLKRRTIQVAASPDPSEPSWARVTPHTIWAVMESPSQARRNHPSGALHFVNSDGGTRPAGEVFGATKVTLKHRRIFAFGAFAGSTGTATLTLKKQYVQPSGIRSYRFGWHSIPGTQYIEQFESSDSSVMGSNQVSRPSYPGPQSINPTGLLSYRSGLTFIELKDRTIYPFGHNSVAMGTLKNGDTPYMWQGLRVGPRVPIMVNGTDMSRFGLTWISNWVRELSVTGFESHANEYQLEAFDRRMRVTRREIPRVPRAIGPIGISSFISGTPNVRSSIHYIRPDGNSDQYRKGAF